MKRYLCLCVVLLALTAANAGEKSLEKPLNTLKATDKASDSKPKRDASLLVGAGGYHGPSYKYLPPSTGGSVYSSYSGGHHGGFGSSSLGHSSSGSHIHHHHSSGPAYAVSHSRPSLHSGFGLGGHGASFAGGFGGGHSYTTSLGPHGYVSGSGGHGHGASTVHHIPSYSGGHGHGASSSLGPIYTSSLGHGGHSSGGFGSSHHHSSVPSYSLSAGHVGSAAGFATGYQYSKGVGASFGAHGSGAGFSSAGGSFGGHGLGDNDEHHVHDGNQAHHYVVSSGSASAGADGYHYETPQTSYGVPLATVGSSYAPKFHSQGSGDESPSYAAGHKGLGHFSFSASKPSVLHTSFVGSEFKAPSFSSVPFKPSTFLGTKFEGSSSSFQGDLGGHAQTAQHYLPPNEVGAGAGEATGYDYAAPSGSAGFGSEIAVGGHEGEASHLDGSYHDPSANYLPPPSSSYGVPH